MKGAEIFIHWILMSDRCTVTCREEGVWSYMRAFHSLPPRTKWKRCLSCAGRSVIDLLRKWMKREALNPESHEMNKKTFLWCLEYLQVDVYYLVFYMKTWVHMVETVGCSLQRIIAPDAHSPTVHCKNKTTPWLHNSLIFFIMASLCHTLFVFFAFPKTDWSISMAIRLHFNTSARHSQSFQTQFSHILQSISALSAFFKTFSP